MSRTSSTSQFAEWTGRFLACHLYPSGSKTRAATCPRIDDVAHRPPKATLWPRPEICKQPPVSPDGPMPWKAPWKETGPPPAPWNVPGCEVFGLTPP